MMKPSTEANIPVKPESHNLLGVQMHAISRDQLVELIGETIAARTRRIIANHNLHSVYVYHHDERMREFYSRAEYAHVDGMALVFLARLMGAKMLRKHRTTYLDLLPALASAAAQHNWKIFYLGSRPNVGERAAVLLREKYPGLQIRSRHGYFDSQLSSSDNQTVLDEIRSYQPDVLLVGMGMPRQETWIAEHFETLPSCAILCSGAMMDYIAGEVPTPPRWIGKFGFEWLYRLLCEPRRLWRRYLLEPWFVARLLLLQFFGFDDLSPRVLPQKLPFRCSKISRERLN